MREYSRATDVLGALVDVVEGGSLGEILKERIFDPRGAWWGSAAFASHGEVNDL